MIKKTILLLITIHLNTYAMEGTESNAPKEFYVMNYVDWAKIIVHNSPTTKFGAYQDTRTHSCKKTGPCLIGVKQIFRVIPFVANRILLEEKNKNDKFEIDLANPLFEKYKTPLIEIFKKGEKPGPAPQPWVKTPEDQKKLEESYNEKKRHSKLSEYEEYDIYVCER